MRETAERRVRGILDGTLCQGSCDDMCSNKDREDNWCEDPIIS